MSRVKKRRPVDAESVLRQMERLTGGAAKDKSSQEQEAQQMVYDSWEAADIDEACDLLVAATISNWGCYALAALLLAACGKTELIHDAEREQRLIATAAAAGFHDAIYGGVDWSVDGCALPAHMSLVTLMKEAVEQGEKRYGK